MILSWNTLRTIGICIISGVFFIGLGSNSNSPAPNGYTGSPADGKTCGTNRGCHGGGATTDNTMISTDIPTEGYKPDAEYNITVTVRQANSSKFGFSFTAQKDNGTELGSLTEGLGTAKSGKYMSHKPTTTSGSGSKSWAFKWTAPTDGTGEVKFYAAGNAANGRGNTSGDNIYTAVAVYQEQSADTTSKPTFVQESLVNRVSVYPNPAQNSAWIILDKSELLFIINLKGEIVKVVDAEVGKTKIALTDLQYGVYYIVNEDKSVHKTLVRL